MEASVGDGGAVAPAGSHQQHGEHSPLTTLYALEHTIAQRRAELGQPQGALFLRGESRGRGKRGCAAGLAPLPGLRPKPGPAPQGG